MPFKNNFENSNELSLTYEIIRADQLATRPLLREWFQVSNSGECYSIPFEKITTREGFNRIIFYDIEELADLIWLYDLQKPLVVDVLKDGRVILEQGERRYKALCLLKEQYSDKFQERFGKIPCKVNGTGVTEQRRKVNIIVSNAHQPLHALDLAIQLKELKFNFGAKKLSDEELAKMAGIRSRQKVQWLLELADLDDRTKKEIIEGRLSPTEAVKSARHKRSLDKQAGQAEEKSHQTNPAPPQQAPDPLKNDLDELKDLENNDDDLEEDNFTEKQVDQFSSKPLDLVGNTVAAPPLSREKKQSEFDTSREEMTFILAAISLSDKIEVMVGKLNVADQDKNDIIEKIGWMRNSMFKSRDWIHKNKPRN